MSNPKRIDLLMPRPDSQPRSIEHARHKSQPRIPLQNPIKSDELWQMPKRYIATAQKFSMQHPLARMDTLPKINHSTLQETMPYRSINPNSLSIPLTKQEVKPDVSKILEKVSPSRNQEASFGMINLSTRGLSPREIQESAFIKPQSHVPDWHVTLQNQTQTYKKIN